jgi:hypothetical protein
MQVRNGIHSEQSIALNNAIEDLRRGLDEDGKRFFSLFEQSTLEGSQAAARKMKKIAKRRTKFAQKRLFFQSLYILSRSGSDMLSWPNSPLLVLLEFVDPDVLSGHENQSNFTALHALSPLADTIDYFTHENQLILAKQLIKHGANVNAVTSPQGQTPLHKACYASNVTNLDFIELLLKKGSDPNAQDHHGATPLMCTTKYAPGAAKFLLNWPTTDPNITSRSGASFLARVRADVKYFSDQVARTDNPERIQHQFLLRQWREIEEMLVEREAVDTGIDTLE